VIARFGLGERGDDRAALLKPGLPGREFAELRRERLEVELSAARGLVEPGAGFGQTALVKALHLHLPRDDRPHKVVVKCDIGCDGGGPGEDEDRERRERK
jgi:hypothetical protein